MKNPRTDGPDTPSACPCVLKSSGKLATPALVTAGGKNVAPQPLESGSRPPEVLVLPRLVDPHVHLDKAFARGRLFHGVTFVDPATARDGRLRVRGPHWAPRQQPDSQRCNDCYEGDVQITRCRQHTGAAYHLPGSAPRSVTRRMAAVGARAMDSHKVRANCVAMLLMEGVGRPTLGNPRHASDVTPHDFIHHWL